VETGLIWNEVLLCHQELHELEVHEPALPVLIDLICLRPQTQTGLWWTTAGRRLPDYSGMVHSLNVLSASGSVGAVILEAPPWPRNWQKERKERCSKLQCTIVEWYAYN